MLRIVTRFFVRVAERWMPDPLVIAIFLTVVTFLAALIFTDFGPGQAVDAWGEGYWRLLEFTAQMILILALGHVVAHTRAVHGALVAITSLVHSARVAYISLTMFAGLAALLSWGLGLVVPAVLARIMASNCRKRGIAVHFPLLIACGYSGALVSMQGLSASIPLVLNTPGHFLERTTGLISLDQTIFSVWSLSIVAAILIILPQVMCRLAPDPQDIVEFSETETTDFADSGIAREGSQTPSEKLENARWVTLLLASLAGLYVVRYFLTGGELQLNSINMVFVVLGLAFADSPRHYIVLLSNAAKIAGPFLIQYPLYAALLGLMAASGLGELFVNGFVSVASAGTLSIWTFFSAAILNLFIPSAG